VLYIHFRICGLGRIEESEPDECGAWPAVYFNLHASVCGTIGFMDSLFRLIVRTVCAGILPKTLKNVGWV